MLMEITLGAARSAAIELVKADAGLFLGTILLGVGASVYFFRQDRKKRKIDQQVQREKKWENDPASDPIDVTCHHSDLVKFATIAADSITSSVKNHHSPATVLKRIQQMGLKKHNRYPEGSRPYELYMLITSQVLKDITPLTLRAWQNSHPNVSDDVWFQFTRETFLGMPRRERMQVV